MSVLLASWYDPSGDALLVVKQTTDMIELYRLTNRVVSGDLNAYHISKEVVAKSQPGVLAAIGGAANARSYAITSGNIDTYFSGAGILSVVKAALRVSTIFVGKRELGTVPASAVETNGKVDPAKAVSAADELGASVGEFASSGIGFVGMLAIGFGLAYFLGVFKK